MTDLSRRDFLKVTGVTLVGSSLAALGFSPTPALAEVRQFKLARATETRNTCTYCSVACGILMYSLGDGAKTRSRTSSTSKATRIIRSIAAPVPEGRRPARHHPQRNAPAPPRIPRAGFGQVAAPVLG
jgi:anaerobic selenocysteine-containing dehydrogenase